MPMASISTLLYVLENLEDESHELYDIQEIFQLEQNLLGPPRQERQKPMAA